MMTLLFILAQDPATERMNEVRRAFRHEQVAPPDMKIFYVYLAGVVTTLATLLIAGHLWQRRNSNHGEARPVQLFLSSLKQLGVGWRDRIVLRLATRRSGLEHPAVMLFSEELLAHHLGAWADRCQIRPLGRYARKRLRAISEKAFAPAA